MNVMLLAAGLGTRLRPATEFLPKPAIPLINVPLLAYPWFHLSQLKPRRLVVNTHHLPNLMKACAGNLLDLPTDVTFLHESPEILGSAGGIRNARTFLEKDDDFWLANGDEVFFPEKSDLFKKAWQSHKESQALATLIVMEHPGVGSQFGGIWCDSNRRVWGIGKSIPSFATAAARREKCQLHGFHFVGFQILSSRIFDYIPKITAPNIFYDVLNLAIEQGEFVHAVRTEGAWFETGNSADMLATTRILVENLAHPNGWTALRQVLAQYWPELKAEYRLRLDDGGFCYQGTGASGVECVQPGGTGETRLVIGNHVRLGKNIKIRGTVVIGHRSEIAGQCSLENCVVGNDIDIGENTTLKDGLFFASSRQ